MRTLLLSIALLLSPAASFAADKPNIVFILADDLGYGDLECYGQKLIKTPNLDRMAAVGLRFTQAYCGTSVCAPFSVRALTDRHIGHAAVRANREIQPEGQFPLPAGTVTVAKVLKDAGYSTALVGKLTFEEFMTNQPDPKAAKRRFEQWDADKKSFLTREAFVSMGKKGDAAMPNPGSRQ